MSIFLNLLNLLVLACFYFQQVKCVDILEPADLMYDELLKENNYTKDYRILKKKQSEETIMVSLDSLGLNYQIQAKYIYDNEEVNAKQEYVFSSYSSHLFLTEYMQRSPSTNKTLIQLYQQSKLIGYEIRLSLQDTSKNNQTEFEFKITYYREEDIDSLEDGTSTKFLNMFSGDSEWKKIDFPVNLMEMMIFTLENAYDIEFFMYSKFANNLTSTTPQNCAIPYTISRYSLKSLQSSQTVMILLRRKYDINPKTTPNIIDFKLSILSIYSLDNKLSIFRHDFANFDVLLPIFNANKILNKKSKNETQKSFLEISNSQLNTSNQNKTFDFQNSTIYQQKKNQTKLLNSEKKNQLKYANLNQTRGINQIENQKQISSKKRQLQLTPFEQFIIQNVMEYEVIFPIYDYTQPFYLGAVASSCNSYIKYQLCNMIDDCSSTNLQLNETDLVYFSDKFSNIDQTTTAKALIKPSEYNSCKPNCFVHAILHIELLLDPQSDFETFKLQSSQIIHDMSNPAKPFFDYLPLLAYTFFSVEVPEDLNQLTIQYFSGYQHCYLLFSHSYVPIKDNNTSVVSESIDDNTLPSQIQQLRRTLQYSGDKFQTELVKYELPEIDLRPVKHSFYLDTKYPTFQSGQLIVKPAKKGIHIFSTINLSPMYSPFTIQVNSFNLRQMTNSSYISITLQGINDLQSLYYDKTSTKDNNILLQFCSQLTDITIYASSCPNNQTISQCHIPSKQHHSFYQNIASKNSSIPDLCPNEICHILFTIQYNPFTVLEDQEESNENQIKKFSVTLIEIGDKSSQTVNKDDQSKNQPKKNEAGNTQETPYNYKWIIISCCILLGLITLASGLMCYIKMKQNKILKQMKRQNKQLLSKKNGQNDEYNEDEDDDEDDDEEDDNFEVGEEFKIKDIESNKKINPITVNEDMFLERTSTNSRQNGEQYLSIG
ncbi:transmembrane protein, putative (macronuclear) [Tetrahymena thermophila SB210]|uniref:Transmembrane protein, putative n=1 Tax=Tetrahymena thermophila (strain SB210) TaxID=312017 RepID=Q24C94_TETTS|nr:transmembrane protein, putative [Tetrahymena thermophila SB210]EAS05344.1 transmembrane protein, putative [Tetrahymena thermophila SB210]|eukprot:XP_001025589.1 transmembrane protein, putative [Tetrahymena thermophila SB210]